MADISPCLASPGSLARDGEAMTDKELVELTLRDQRYFLYLMRRYEGKLYCYIMRITRAAHEDAEDILQDVFIKVYENLNDFNTDLKFSSWIYRITHNQVISNFRKLQARLQHDGTPLSDEIANRLASSLDIEKELDSRYLRENIDKILNTLDSKYREVLVLRFLEEKDYNEISDILKKPVGTVASLVNRGKKIFRETISRQNIKL